MSWRQKSKILQQAAEDAKKSAVTPPTKSTKQPSESRVERRRRNLAEAKAEIRRAYGEI